MGKPTGFKEYPRKAVAYRDPMVRVNDFGEIAYHGKIEVEGNDLDIQELRAVFTQAGLLVKVGDTLPDGTIVGYIDETGGVAINDFDVALDTDDNGVAGPHHFRLDDITVTSTAMDGATNVELGLRLDQLSKVLGDFEMGGFRPAIRDRKDTVRRPDSKCDQWDHGRQNGARHLDTAVDPRRTGGRRTGQDLLLG